ncbi:glycoside hydrolase family 3 N-terminal domain-containing protein [Lewinella sp. JB7]|uniref:glycoside hydrolase family 3 N-terminal domain-containing protein n=1 Tax=Lewinella sp. JB7 TaxID=2962887 RepID=UPI0020C94FB7|nr:glycoside hydrolase family 3 N-terminal domain-containing protein [Lewinella sp. JB7]MCP9236843.1 serine hydrolase [Lewinella sp. JB7]
MRVLVFCFLTVLCLSPTNNFGQNIYNGDLSRLNADERRWVDSVYASMSVDERLGQLFMIRAHSDLGPDHVASVEKQIKNYHVGGLCFFQGTPEKQLELTNRYQGLSKLPMMVSMDAEWGLGMRLPGQTISYPKQLALGAIRNNQLLYDMGAEIARQMHRLGVNVSFSPVLDVNNNPDNPVIATRSFGEDRYNVTAKGYMYMKGLQDNGILASAKHFPGHGDTDVDSHLDLPVIKHSRARLDSIELYPFRALIRYGIGSMMAAHLQIPALDPRPNRPSSLSKPIVTDLLRKELGFTGLIFTDGLEMKGVTKHYGDGEVEAEAIAAGSDILLLPEDIAASFTAIKRYVEEGKITERGIEEKVRRVLLAKYRLGLTHPAFPPLKNLRAELNTPAAYTLKQELVEASMTLVRDAEGLVPVQTPDKGKIISLRIGAAKPTTFTTRLDDYGQITHLTTANDPSAAEKKQILDRIRANDVVIVSLYSDGSRFIEKVPISAPLLGLLRAIDEKSKLVLTVFGNPYSLAPLDGFGTILEAYTRDEVAQDAAAQALFGANRMTGRLPVTASPAAPYNAGLETTANFRMGYSTPESVGLDGEKLAARVDVLAREAISQRATPGMVVLVARHGKIVFEKAYGHQTYQKERPVTTNDVYDLASVTKVAATTLCIMKLVDEGKIDLDKPLSHYLPELAGTNKEYITIRPILAHRAGLHSWIPFYRYTLGPGRNAQPSSQYYRTAQTGNFVIPVTDKLYMNKSYVDSIWQQIYDSPLPNIGRYRYSDLGFYLMAKLVDRVSGLTVDEFAARYFYRPMGLESLTFNPLRSISRDRIPPTEIDNYFRMSAIQGFVHDMGAGMMGGVSGHAGLFGSAHDVAALFQMLLQEGSYGGRRYLSAETIHLFTNRFPGDMRRGLGFDMKQLDSDRSLNVSERVSSRTFGHLGFTGTAVWADPVEDLVYVFLSNRTYPNMENNKLSKLDTRNSVQTAAYEAIIRDAKSASPRTTVTAGVGKRP